MAARRDTTAPTANITAPANGAQLTSPTINITGTGVDATGVTNLRLFVGTTQIASQNFTASKNITRSLSVSYTLPSFGSWGIRCEARDAAGNVGSRSINITYASTTSSTTTAPPPPPSLPSSKILAAPASVNQGGEGSCMAMATALAASIEKYYTTGATSYSQSTNIMSPEYLYDLRAPGDGSSACGSGSSLLGNISLLKTRGVCRWNVLRYSDGYNPGSCQYDPVTGQLIPNTCVWTYPCQKTVKDTTPTCYCAECHPCCIGATQDADAALNKITGYKSWLGTDVYSLKRLIANNHPLLFSVQMDRNLYNGGGGDCNYIWNSRGELMFGHGMALIGYDDAKQAFLIQNSWGTGWGCNGRIWVDYAFFGTIAGNIYAVTMRNDLNYFPIL